MDRDKAITSFLQHVDHLTRLPFITDQEFKELYGQDVAVAFGELERLNQEEMICHRCESNCCREYGCEFYASRFGQCPIHDLRPAICRFHFCEKFQSAGKAVIKDLTEIFLYSVSAAAANGSRSVKFFNPPPFAGAIPGLIEIILPLITGVQSEALKPEDAQKNIRKEVMKYNP